MKKFILSIALLASLPLQGVGGFGRSVKVISTDGKLSPIATLKQEDPLKCWAPSGRTYYDNTVQLVTEIKTSDYYFLFTWPLGGFIGGGDQKLVDNHNWNHITVKEIYERLESGGTVMCACVPGPFNDYHIAIPITKAVHFSGPDRELELYDITATGYYTFSTLQLIARS